MVSAFPASSGRVIRFFGSWPGSAFSSRHIMRVSMIGRICHVSHKAFLREPLSQPRPASVSLQRRARSGLSSNT